MNGIHFNTERSNEANFARSALLIQDNEIDIYIEDTKTGFKKLYVNILERYFSNKKITDVHPLGPRSTVIKTCKTKVNNKEIDRPSLFIVDGDLFLLKGESPLPNGVFRLPMYSIENAIINQESLVEFLNEEESEKYREQIENELDFINWARLNRTHLIDLFVHYALIQKLNIPGIKTISHKVANLTKNDSPIVSKVLTEQKIMECKSAIISKYGKDKYDNEKLTTENNLTQKSCTLLTHVAGKDYLLPLLRRQLKKVNSKEHGNINLIQRLALKCPTDFLKGCDSSIVTKQ